MSLLPKSSWQIMKTTLLTLLLFISYVVAAGRGSGAMDESRSAFAASQVAEVVGTKGDP